MYPGKGLQEAEDASLPARVLLARTGCHVLPTFFLPSVQCPLLELTLPSPHLPHLIRRLLAEEEFWTVRTS